MKYGKINTTTGRLQSVEIYEGETIEQKVNRIVNNNEPITDSAYRDWETDRKSTRLNSSHITRSRMPSSA